MERTKPIYIIAEAGVNHNGSFERAIELIDAGVNAGVDCVKFQTFKTELLVSADAKKQSTSKILRVPGKHSMIC
nr:N-acetylneuraminate synthase family protein [Salinispira pacifica]